MRAGVPSARVMRWVWRWVTDRSLGMKGLVLDLLWTTKGETMEKKGWNWGRTFVIRYVTFSLLMSTYAYTHNHSQATNQASPQLSHSPQQHVAPILAPLTFDRSLAEAEPSRSYISRSPAQRNVSLSDTTHGNLPIQSIGEGESGAAREERRIVPDGEGIQEEVIEDVGTCGEALADQTITTRSIPAPTTPRSISAKPEQDAQPPLPPFHHDDVFSEEKKQTSIPDPSSDISDETTVQGDKAYSLEALEPVVGETVPTPRIVPEAPFDAARSGTEIGEPKGVDVQSRAVLEQHGASAISADGQVAAEILEDAPEADVEMSSGSLEDVGIGSSDVAGAVRAGTTVATSVPPAPEIARQGTTESRRAIDVPEERSATVSDLDRHDAAAPEQAVQETATPIPAGEAEPDQSVETPSIAVVDERDANIRDSAAPIGTSLQKGTSLPQAMEIGRYSAPTMESESQSGHKLDQSDVPARTETMSDVVGAGDEAGVTSAEEQGGSTGVASGLQIGRTVGSTEMELASTPATAHQQSIVSDAMEPPRSPEDDTAGFVPVIPETTVPSTAVAAASREPGLQDAPADLGSGIVSGKDYPAVISTDIHDDVLFDQQSTSAVSEAKGGVLDSLKSDKISATSAMQTGVASDASVSSPVSKRAEGQKEASQPPAETPRPATEAPSVGRAPVQTTPSPSQKKVYSSRRTSSHSSYNASADPDEAHLHEARTSTSTAFMNRGGMWIGTPPVPLDSVAIKTLEMAQREPRSPSAIEFPTDNLGEVSTSETSLVAPTPPVSQPPMLPFVPRFFAPKLTLEFKWADRLLPSDVTLDTTDATESSGTPQRGRRISLYETAMALSGYGANFVPRNRVTSRAHGEYGKK